jgi:RNA polymerase sigma factor (sigma-70 family)
MSESRNISVDWPTPSSSPSRPSQRGRASSTEERLVGEEAALRAVYEQSYRPLVTHFIALSGSRSEAQDVVQESFLVAGLHRNDFAEAGNKEAWLRAVALNRMRRRRRWSRLTGPAWPRFRSELSIDLGPQASEDHLAIVYALSRLILPVRDAVVLHYIDDLSVEQIAHELSVPEGTVKGRLARARAELAGTPAAARTPTTSDLAGFARDTGRSLDQPPFQVMIRRRRRERRRRSAAAGAGAAAAALAVALAITGVGRDHQRELPSGPAPQSLLPEWTAEQIVGNPDAFVVTQLGSRTHVSAVLTVWKRCTQPRPDHDCFGREAIAVADGAGHRLTALGAVTGSSQQPSLGDDGLLREVGAGLWYWAHTSPGPYLVSATMSQPVHPTVLDRAVTHSFGVPGIECADRVGLCTLNLNARTLERLALPGVPDTRWATPTTRGCGLWGLAGAGGNLRLVIQQRDGSFASADIPEDRAATGMAEGGPDCEIAYYQGIAENKDQLVVSLDQGRTWQIRQTPMQQVAGYLEQQPRLRELIPPHWAQLPAMPHPLATPGPLHPL